MSSPSQISLPVEVLDIDEALDLRQAVLWPQLDRDGCRVEGDEQATHFGLKLSGDVICCLSVFDLGAGCMQIRKFATSQAYQRKGFGAYLLRHVLQRLGNARARTVVLDARETAVTFYLKNGFKIVSDRFEKQGVMHYRMECHLPMKGE